MVKEIVVLSGKGGTGKTMLVASFAALAREAVLADCDVDAPNLHLLLDPKIVEKGDFAAARRAVIDGRKCTSCRKCVEACRFGAAKVVGSGNLLKVTIDSVSCEGCGVCARICPADAIALRETKSGEWFVSSTRYGTLVHALLEPGGENSGKLVALVKHKARALACQSGAETVLVDGPPGIGCPAISALSGSDMVLVVAEPTRAGAGDFSRLVELAKGFGSHIALVINRFDINETVARSIEAEASRDGIPVLGHLPFDEEVVSAMAKGLPVVEAYHGRISSAIAGTWERLCRIVGVQEAHRGATAIGGAR